jgi:hypothetical protein
MTQTLELLLLPTLHPPGDLTQSPRGCCTQAAGSQKLGQQQPAALLWRFLLRPLTHANVLYSRRCS